MSGCPVAKCLNTNYDTFKYIELAGVIIVSAAATISDGILNLFNGNILYLGTAIYATFLRVQLTFYGVIYVVYPFAYFKHCNIYGNFNTQQDGKFEYNNSVNARVLFTIPIQNITVDKSDLKFSNLGNKIICDTAKLLNSYLYYYHAVVDYAVFKNIVQIYDSTYYYVYYDLYFYSGESTRKINYINIIDYELTTNRPTSESINYSGEKKPRINWLRGGAALQNYPVNFYYTLKFKIYSTSGVLSGVNIDINNGAYIGATDVNGYCEIQYLGRVALRDPAYPNSNTYYTKWTDYLDLTIKISKDGYRTETISISGIDEVIDFKMRDILLLPELKVSSSTFTHPTTYANGTISLVAAGGVAPYQYSIDGGTSWHSSGDFTGLLAGSYDIMVKDNEGTIVEGGTIILKSSDFINVEDMTIEVENEQVLVEVEQEDEVIVVIE